MPSTGACRSSSSNREAQVVPGRPPARPVRRRRQAARPASTASRSRPNEVAVRMALTSRSRSREGRKGCSQMSLLKRIESARPGRGAAPPSAPGPARRRPAVRPARADRRRPVARLMSQAPVRESFRDVKFRIQTRVIQDLDPKLDLSNQVEVRRQIEEIFGKVIDEEGLALTRAERVRMLEQITDEIIGLGPLEPLLRDETITEVMVNGPRQVYIERGGKLELTNVVFQNDDHVMRIIDRIIAPIGRRVDESEPDGRRPPDRRLARQRDHPAAVAGRARSSRSASSRPRPFTVDDLIRFGTATPEMFDFLQGLRRGPPEHLRLRRHRLGQDDHAQRPVLVHPERRAHRHDRGRRRAPAPPGARRHARVAAARTSRARARSRSATWCATPCACGPTGSSSASAAAARRSTCSRP